MKRVWPTRSAVLLQKFAKSERMLIAAVMIIVGVMSGVLSNTGTAAVLIPVVIGIAAKSGYSRSRLLMPLVFAAAMGGNLSLIGAPGNMIAQSALSEIGLSFGFFGICHCRTSDPDLWNTFSYHTWYEAFTGQAAKRMTGRLIPQLITAMYRPGSRSFHW